MEINKNPIDLTFQNVTVTVKTKQGKKQLLSDVSGICKSSQITAILGSSGAGKTTLLNVLTDRIENSKAISVRGKIQANQTEITYRKFSDFGTYVMQDDILLETMTVKECLQFAANLKTPGNQLEKDKVVQETIKILKLERCQNTLIGGQFVKKGISGGERKRTSIGFELVTNPSVIILDEPTSGLDSFTAYLLIAELKRYAINRQKTIVFTIHSPSSDIWQMFDRIMLLVEGQFIYQGKSNEAILNYFSNQGFNCPRMQNPADYFMSLMHLNQKNAQNYPIYFQKYGSLLKLQVEKEIEQREKSEILAYKFQTPFLYQLQQIAKRSLKNVKRNPILFRARIIQAIIMGLIVGLIYFQSEDGSNHPTSIRHMNDRNGLLFFVCINQLMMSLKPCSVSFPSMRKVFLREDSSNLYSPYAYFFGRLAIEIIPQIISPILYGLIQFFMVGLNDRTVGNVFFYFFCLILNSLLGLSLGYIGGSIFSDVKTAVFMSPLIFVPNALFGGFFKNRKNLASWISWIEYLFPIKYSFNAIAANEYENTHFIPSPTELLNLEFSKWECVYILLGFIIGLLIISCFCLVCNRKRLQ
ncbi:ABC transporter family protein (macronuclear) [Tetrahymena thermophila SB210]|uniref:ABC transporter family protein n=1 Tax=Tetrahymena thermophila (strain SB210) TaxID=312017 RepID=W7XIS0_TETTS|nr:ABC transporter family protein [Tetrahymena thermophila SB210]EWS74861.1 ABC transporter family protein [Tetrahymena thermophila SB210]|eukprot:XP_012652574.1 ABC transporter family protein [Tetrahymena thermophila SB210]